MNGVRPEGYRRNRTNVAVPPDSRESGIVGGMIRHPRAVLVILATLASAGCATVAQVSNFGDTKCAGTFESQLSSILTDEGEKTDVADTLAHRTFLTLTRAELGPRPFLVSSSSGADYTFFVQKKRERCLLRLYGRRKGFVTYTNNLTYIATRELPGCSCAE